MLRRLRLLFSFFLTSVIYHLSSLPVFAQEAWNNPIFSGRCLGPASLGAADVATIRGLECLFYNVLQIIVLIAGLVFFAVFVVNGFNYLFSGNDPKKLASISSSLTMSIAGLIGIIVSWLILSFIQSFTGFNVTDFKFL